MVSRLSLFFIWHRFASLTVQTEKRCGYTAVQGKVDRAEGLSRMKAWQKDFYTSQAWKKTREAYKQSVGGLCEICWGKGIVKAGELVHHKISLTPQNYLNTELSLDYSNLQCLCRDCHADIHRKRRFKLDEMGRVIF